MAPSTLLPMAQANGHTDSRAREHAETHNGQAEAYRDGWTASTRVDGDMFCSNRMPACGTGVPEDGHSHQRESQERPSHPSECTPRVDNGAATGHDERHDPTERETEEARTAQRDVTAHPHAEETIRNATSRSSDPERAASASTERQQGGL